MQPDYEQTASSQKNNQIIVRAVQIVAEQNKVRAILDQLDFVRSKQIEQDKDTAKYVFDNQEFTLADCISFATTTFNGWRMEYKNAKDPERQRRAKKHKDRSRRYARQTAVSDQ